VGGGGGEEEDEEEQGEEEQEYAGVEDEGAEDGEGVEERRHRGERRPASVLSRLAFCLRPPRFIYEYFLSVGGGRARVVCGRGIAGPASRPDISYPRRPLRRLIRRC